MAKKTYIEKLLQEKRKLLIDTLKRKGITDDNIIRIMNELPREKFVSERYIDRAYEDNALPIDSGQTISQPYTVAYMTGLLGIKEGDKILEIGTGSGYQASILYLLGAKVFTVERIQKLYEKANMIFKELGFHINTRFADGTLGWREFAPYSGIIVTAASPRVPDTLLEQLEIGGRIVIPVGDKISQTMHILERTSKEEYDEYETDHFKFVPLIGKEAWESE